MNQFALRWFALICFIVAGCVLANAQVSASAPISGVVKDPNGAVVVGATVSVKNPGNGQEFTTTTTDNGTFTVPAVEAGNYTIRVTAQGFKVAVVKDLTVLAGTPANVEVTLQVGAPSEEIQVTGSGEVLNTTSATVANTITGRQITDLPFASRNALDLVLFLPGTNSPARPRQSTVNGLPKGGLNITLDGVNVQDNLLKSSDGFFTYIQPKTDAVDEVTVSTATPGAENSGEGAVQIKFITKSGSNTYTGSLYEYMRNPSFNANYYFNNLAGLPRTRVILNQFGGRLGGPIIKDRAFFFVNYEEYRLPEATLRQRVVMSTAAQNGDFTYAGHTVNVLAVAAAAGANGCGFSASPTTCASTVDPTVGALLNQIRGTFNQGSVTALTDPNLQQFNFINKDVQLRRFPTVRFDFNITSKQHLSNVYNYQNFASGFDFLNNVDPAFPGFPNFGSQGSNRFNDAMTLRSTLTSTMVNEATFGILGGTTRFFPEITSAQFANQGGLSLGISAFDAIQNATVSRAPQKRNSPVKQFNDNLSWTRGDHSLNFGFSFTQVNLFQLTNPGGVVSAITFGLSPNDLGNNLFAPANFPGASTTQLGQAKALYAVLTGNISAISGTAAVNENTGTYTNLGQFVERDRQREMGFFGQDSWRFRPNLTLSGGLRWEVQFPFVSTNNAYGQTSEAGLFGVSGLGNLFSPGTLTGSVTQFNAFAPGSSTYNTQYGNFAPSLGFAWSPNLKEGWLRKLGGENGQTVIRGGYSLAYVREGTDFISAALSTNPGGTLNDGVSYAIGNLASSPTLLRNPLPPLVTPPASLSYPITASTATSAAAFIPDLKTGRVHSWNLSLQRELNKDTVLEFRYVGNRAMDLWRTYNINETDVSTNGFINEFNLAEQNLIANNAATDVTHHGSFAYFGPGSGTSPLPTIFGYLQGVGANSGTFNNPLNYASTLWKSSTFTTLLNPALPNALSFGSTLAGNPALFAANAQAAGIAANFFNVNPTIGTNGSFIVDNSGRSYYDAMVIELRRRLAHGFLFQGSYTFSKSLTNMFGSSAVGNVNYISLHNRGGDRVVSPFDINHALKANFIYEFPLGKGQRFLDTGNGIADHLISGWSFNGTTRIQSGTAFSLGNVQLVGMSRQELQHEIAIGHSSATSNGITSGIVTYLPPDIIQNTINAFNGTFAPTGRYIAPANMNAAIPFAGAVGFPNLILYGPHFVRFDLSFVKKTKINERINLEFRTELLDAFNNSNIRVTSPNNDVGAVGGLGSSTFGQTTFAYQDLSTTNDPGGRLIQFVLRVNF